MKLKDIVIMLMVLIVLALLVWFFVRPVEPARQIVFGDLGRHAFPTNTVAGGGPASNSISPVDANFPRPNQPGQVLDQQSNRPMDSTDGALANSNSASPSNLNSSADATPPADTNANGSSNMAVTGPLTNDSSQSIPPQTSVTASSSSTPSPSPPPALSQAQSFSTNTAVYDDPWKAAPSSTASTARLLAEAKSAGTASAEAPPSRTADMLEMDTEPRWWFDPRAGSNVVFILDNSMNMLTNGKSFFARRELLGALRAMNASQLFYVLLFHSGGYEGMPSLTPIPASPENVRSMTNWLFSVGHRAGADPDKAIRRALGLAPAPDMVWLLAGGPLSSNVIDNVREANAGPNARIDTVDLYTRDGERTLREIADENRGAYHFVPPPGHGNPSPP